MRNDRQLLRKARSLPERVQDNADWNVIGTIRNRADRQSKLWKELLLFQRLDRASQQKVANYPASQWSARKARFVSPAGHKTVRFFDFPDLTVFAAAALMKSSPRDAIIGCDWRPDWNVQICLSGVADATNLRLVLCVFCSRA